VKISYSHNFLKVILGIPYSYPMDLWSFGCTLYEIFTGKVCFPGFVNLFFLIYFPFSYFFYILKIGDDNNEMMKLFLDLKGLPSKKFLKKASFRSEYFDSDFNFLWSRVDQITKTNYVKKITIDLLMTPERDLKAELLGLCKKADEKTKALQLYDLLDKIFTLDPMKRITIEEVLRHPFLATKQ
jgi:serine/threonine-protein kinase PRP4